MTPRPLWSSPDKDGHVWSVACQTTKLGLPNVRVEGNPRVQKYWLEEHVDYELYSDPSNIGVDVGNIVMATPAGRIEVSEFVCESCETLYPSANVDTRIHIYVNICAHLYLKMGKPDNIHMNQWAKARV